MFGKEKSQYIEDSKFRYTMREMKKNGSAYILALPYFLLFLIFTGIPVVISLPVGFTNFNMVQFPQWVGLSNFYTLFLQDDVFLIAIQNTLVFAIITGPVSYIACFLLAWLINEMPGPLKTVFTYIFYAPTLAGNIYATWQLIFSGDTVIEAVVTFFLVMKPLFINPVFNQCKAYNEEGKACIVKLFGKTFASQDEIAPA